MAEGFFIQHSNLRLWVPNDWVDNSQVIASGPEDEGFTPNCVFSQEPTSGEETAAEFAARQLPSLRQELCDYKLVKEGFARFGSNIGFLREHTFEIQEIEEMKGQRICQFQFYVVAGGRAFTFTVTHLYERPIRQIAEQIFTNSTVISSAP